MSARFVGMPATSVELRHCVITVTMPMHLFQSQVFAFLTYTGTSMVLQD